MSDPKFAPMPTFTPDVNVNANNPTTLGGKVWTGTVTYTPAIDFEKRALDAEAHAAKLGAMLQRILDMDVFGTGFQDEIRALLKDSTPSTSGEDK